MLSKQKTMEALETMYEMFPEAHGELKHNNPFELLIAVILKQRQICLPPSQHLMH